MVAIVVPGHAATRHLTFKIVAIDREAHDALGDDPRATVTFDDVASNVDLAATTLVDANPSVAFEDAVYYINVISRVVGVNADAIATKATTLIVAAPA